MQSWNETPDWLNENKIFAAMESGKKQDAVRIREIIAKAREAKGVDLDESAILFNVTDPDLLADMYDAARTVKEQIYGKRIVLFSPLYFSNTCENECKYCAFRMSNGELKRRVLSFEQIEAEIRALINMGQKRVLLIGGENSSDNGFRYLLKAIDTAYATKDEKGAEVRRVNVNVAPLGIEQYTALEKAGVGTYQLFQETYHRETYSKVHVAGPKSDFNWRATAMDRAMLGGFGDVGMGVLLGLYNWRFDALALFQHIEHLESRFGIGCHTISVPRIEPALGSDLSASPPNAVTDDDFKKAVAVMRLTVPYTGIIMSTRETPEMRRETFSLGVSQISGGSCTGPGGYTDKADEEQAQFTRGDHRSLDEVVRDVAESGFIPSFCVACEERGRTGNIFMPLAKKGIIKKHCTPNAIQTAVEYAHRYAAPETKDAILKRVDVETAKLDDRTRAKLENSLAEVVNGGRPIAV